MSDVAMGESSISEYIEDYTDLNVSYSKLFLKEKNTFTNGDNPSDVIMLGDCILKKYKNDLDNILQSKTLTYEEQQKYFYNPWVLSYDLYGTVEFWFLILEANNMSSVIEFNQETINVYNGSLPDVIDTILSLEEDFINTNEEEIDNEDIGISPEMLEYEDEENEDDYDNIEEDEEEDDE